jgi:hypothetical protein
MYDLDEAKTSSKSERLPSMPDLCEVYKFRAKKWDTVRLLKGIVSTAGYWVKTKSKDGKKTVFYTVCPSYDPATQERDTTKYDPWRDLQDAETAKFEAEGLDKAKAREKGHIQYAQYFWMNAIIRSIQKSMPASLPKHTSKERKSGFKDKESDSWTAVRVIRVGKSLAEKIKKLKGLNIVESSSGATKPFSLDDPKFGRDVRIQHDPDAAPSDQYSVAMGEKRMKLTEDELAMLTWDLEGSAAKCMVVAEEKEIKRDFDSWASRNGIKVAGKKKAKPTDDDEEEDEEEAPKKKGKKVVAKKSTKKKSKSDDDDEDEDEEDDEESEEDDEDEEEDEPAPKKKAKAKPAVKGKKAKPADDDDDDFDEDDEESEDDDEEEAPKKGKKAAPAKKPVKKKSKSDDDDEDDLDDDEDSDDSDDSDDFDEDEDEAPKKSKKGSKPAPAKKKAKPADDDDDFDEDDEDDEESEDDEDEEDEPAPKKKAKPAAKKSAPAKKVAAKKKKPVDDDEDEDDFDEDDE